MNTDYVHRPGLTLKLYTYNPPMKLDVELEFAVQTDIGLVRSRNEDSVAISPTHGFAILADGMGGYRAGEVASSIATSVLTSALEEGLDRLQRRVDWSLHRNRQIHQLLVESIQHVNFTVLDVARLNRNTTA